MNEDRQRGFALVAVMVLAALLITVLGTYFIVTRTLQSATRSTMNATRSGYAAEAGLNLRLNTLRGKFEGYQLPTGSPPPVTPGSLPCQSGDPGSGDFQCLTYSFASRDIPTYVEDDAGNPEGIIVPNGELYETLRASQYRFDLNAVAVGSRSRAEAIASMRVRVRLIPLFQFAAFYNKDLEILPGPAMTLEGPVHSNKDLYLDSGGGLTISGQTTATGAIFEGRKEANSCNGGGVAVFDPSSPVAFPGCSGSRIEMEVPDLAPWNGQVRRDVTLADVPAPEALDPIPGELYWDNADARIVLNVNGATPAVEVRTAAGTVDVAATAALTGCSGAASTGTSLYNHRESTNIRMLEIDAELLLECLYDNPLILGGKGIDDVTDGGLVWYFTVDGPDSDVYNDYGVRLKNAADLEATDAAAPEIRGLTVVTSQAIYLEGDYNAVDKKPAGILADSLNVLSNAWSDANSADDLTQRIATATVINAAFLAGTDSTGGGDGIQDSGDYNGGLENYPRFHEDWGGVTLQYRGSFISLNEPRHVSGAWGDQSYSPPIRDWGFDLDFNDAAFLPPLSPRFVYVVQDLFQRRFAL